MIISPFTLKKHLEKKNLGLKEYLLFKAHLFLSWSIFLLEESGNLCHLWNIWIGTGFIHSLSSGETFKRKVST